METKNEKPKKVMVVDFTVFNTRSTKTFIDMDVEAIKLELSKIWDGYVLHYIDEYIVESHTRYEFVKPFEISTENAESNLKTGDEKSNSD